MGIKKYKPTSPGIRFQTGLTFEEITTREPLKALVQGTSKTGGRNNNGRITVRHRGGGHKRRFRVVDFKRDKNDVPGKVVNVEYDPNRSARLALINYADGDKRYIIWPQSLKVGDSVVAGDRVDIKPGNCLPLEEHPLGNDGAQRGDEDRQGRPDHPFRGGLRSVDGQGKRLCAGQASLGRSSHDPGPLPRDCGSGGQPGS